MIVNIYSQEDKNIILFHISIQEFGYVVVVVIFYFFANLFLAIGADCNPATQTATVSQLYSYFRHLLRKE